MMSDQQASGAAGDAASEARPGWRRHVALFLTGQTVSLLGSMIVQYVVFWYLTIEYKSGGIIALVAVFGFLPQALVSIFGGVWADRHNRKLLIMAADALIAVATICLAGALALGIDSIWLIISVLALRSAGAGVQTPAVGALIPQLAPKDKLIKVNGVNSSIQSAMALIAPAIAAALYAVASSSIGGARALAPILLIDVVTAIIGIGLILPIPVESPSETVRRGYFVDLAEGVRYAFGHQFVRWLLVVFGMVFLLAAAPSLLTPLMAVREFDAGEVGNSINLAALEVMYSLGATLGGVLVASVFAKRSRISMVLWSSVAMAVLSIALGLSPNIWVFFAFMLMVGLFVPFFSAPSMTLLQETVEPERIGRVFGLVSIVMAVAMPLGMVVYGPLADRMPIGPLLVAAGVAMLAFMAVAIMAPAGRRAITEARAVQEKPS